MSGDYKKDYAAGEKFDATNLVVEAVYSDGSKQPITDYTIDNGDQALVKGMTSVTVRYTLDDEVKTVEVTITVGDARLESIAASGKFKTEYTEGDLFDKTGLVVTATYTDGDRDVTADAKIVNGDQALAFGASKVTVSYGGMTADIDISVAMTAPWLRAEKSTAQYVFAVYVQRTANQYSWTAIELFSDNTFRATSVFMNNKNILHTGTYEIKDNIVTLTIGENGYVTDTPTTTAFAKEGTFVGTLVKNGETVTGLSFAYQGENDTLLGIKNYYKENDKGDYAVVMETVVDHTLSWELLSVIPKTLRYVTELQVEGEPKKNYTEGDIFDKGEMKVFAVYNDGARYDVTEHATYPTDKLAAGAESVTITFGEKEVIVSDLTVAQVAEAKVYDIEVSGEYKKAYRIGEKINLTGMVVSAKYTGGQADVVLEQSQYTVAIKDNDAQIAGIYLSANVTLVVTYGEFSKEVELIVSFVEPWDIAKTSTADYVYVTYAIKSTSSSDDTKCHYTWSVIELYGDLTTGGTYIATNRFTTKNWKEANNYIVYAGTYSIVDGKVNFADPAASANMICTDKSTTSVFYNTGAKGFARVETGFFAEIVDNGTQLSFAYGTDQKDKGNDTLFQFKTKGNTAVVMKRVVDGVIPTDIEEKIPSSLKKS